MRLSRRTPFLLLILFSWTLWVLLAAIDSSKFISFVNGVGQGKSAAALIQGGLDDDKNVIVIIGAGPTGLGAGYRLLEQIHSLPNSTNVIILEKEIQVGGLASSYRDEHGFLWDNGGHVVFSHYNYFDNVLHKAVTNWNKCSRASYAYMMGSSGKRRFIPYPVQHNIHVMDKNEQEEILRGLEITKSLTLRRTPKNFDEWLIANFGEGLSKIFMRKYNRKVWTVDTQQMNVDWIGERVAVPEVNVIKSKIAQGNDNETNEKAKDSNWGPNKVFEYPVSGGTGQIWKNIARYIPHDWFRLGHTVTSIDTENKVIDIVTLQGKVCSIVYDHLISTAPLDEILPMIKDSSSKLKRLKKISKKFVYSHTHIVGIGLEGQPPPFLADKSWIYLPDSDSPFYRITVFSSYADDNVPLPGKGWSLMCEIAEPKHSSKPAHWHYHILINETINALVNYGFIKSNMVLSTYHRRLEHGYPVPFLNREAYLSEIQPWLESRSVYSRGRFGGWRYEVSNQDHSFMQGVEIMDYILFGTPEETYPNASHVNSMKASDRSLCYPRDYEIVVAHYNENISWLAAYANHTIVYHKGGNNGKKQINVSHWEVLPNVGRESHTYLYHIIKYYDCLANVTFFVQGKMNDHVECKKYCDITQYIEGARQKGFFALHQGTYKNWGRINHIGKWKRMLAKGQIKKANSTVGEFWNLLVGQPHPQKVSFSPGAIFAVDKQRILSKPKSFYKRAISFVDHHPNPEEGHYFERLWVALLS